MERGQHLDGGEPREVEHQLLLAVQEPLVAARLRVGEAINWSVRNEQPVRRMPMGTTHFTTRLVSVTSVLLLSHLWGRDMATLAVYDLSTRRLASIDGSALREVVVSASPERSSFFTIARVGPQQLAIRERGGDGDVLSTFALPFFVPSYAGHSWIGLAPDHAQAVFYNDSTKGLSLVSLADGRQRDLVANVFHSPVELVLLSWLGPDTVLFVKETTPTGTDGPAGVTKISIGSGERKEWHRSITFGGGHAVSKSGELLALREGTLGERIAILDVATMETRATVPATASGAFVGRLCWLGDGRRLVFERAGGGIGCYDMRTGDTQDLTPTENAGYRLRGAAGNYVILGKRALFSRYSYLLQDVATGTREPLAASINGEVYGIAAGKLVMEVGY